MPLTQHSPLRPAGEIASPESPEAMAISALVASGQFNPERYNLSADDLSCWGRVWAFATNYQASSGIAPPLEVLRRVHPEFEFTPSVDTAWAVNELRRASGARQLRTAMATAVSLLDEGDLEAAHQVFDTLARPSGRQYHATSVFDHSTTADTFATSRIQVPYPSLGRVSGGIAPGELWVIFARLNQGKSWVAANFAATAALAGFAVRYLSLEMGERPMSGRLHKILAARTGNRKIITGLASDSFGVRKQALDSLAAFVDGSVEVVDPSRGRFTTSSVAGAMEDADLVVIDHIGLMRTDDGRRAVEDWRTMTTISNSIKEAALATGVPVLAVAQANRDADTAGASTPKLSQISQADAIGQDADVAIPMRRLSARVLVHFAEKVREGPQARWFSLFDPANGRFEEIDRDKAEELQSLDDDQLHGRR